MLYVIQNEEQAELEKAVRLSFFYYYREFLTVILVVQRNHKSFCLEISAGKEHFIIVCQLWVGFPLHSSRTPGSIPELVLWAMSACVSSGLSDFHRPPKNMPVDVLCANGGMA